MKRPSKLVATLASALVGSALFSLACAEESTLMEIKASDFDENSATVTNPWHPLEPGTQYIYDGWTEEEGEKIIHQVVFTVTDLVKEINGIQVAVVYDRDFSEERLLEAELTFFAQDKKGNVWHLGQHREMYDETELVGGRAWMVGHLEGAKAGIMMKANPTADGKDYSQGYAPSPFNWTDRARGWKSGETTEVPYGTFDNVFITEEWNDEEPGAIQTKYYAEGFGVVRVGWSGDDNNKEELTLTEVKKLNADEMAQIRAEALGLEERAYVYASTKPATPRGGGGASGGHSSTGDGNE